jgi:murein tripeptide amidase MpaA
MANPDGVAHGNSRTNVKGYDINRCWEKGKSIITRETAETECMNKYIQALMQTKKIDYAIDLHSHSKDFGSFAYFS